MPYGNADAPASSVVWVLLRDGAVWRRQIVAEKLRRKLWLKIGGNIVPFPTLLSSAQHPAARSRDTVAQQQVRSLAAVFSIAGGMASATSPRGVVRARQLVLPVVMASGGLWQHACDHC